MELGAYSSIASVVPLQTKDLNLLRTAGSSSEY